MSYLRLTEQGILLDYREISANWFVEYWELDNTTYECHWLPQSSNLPTTIYKI